MFEYKINLEAEEDITRIFEYGIYRFGIQQAEVYYNMLYNCFSKITANPFLFPEAYRFREGYRFCVCGSDTIYYRINKNQIEIMAIIGRQDF